VILTKHQIKSLRWGSHIPVSAAVIKTFPIIGALELGAGRHSTKFLFDNLRYVTSIENDLNWIGKLRLTIPEDEHHQIIHHPIPENIKLGTPRKEIDNDVLNEASDFYRKHVDLRFGYLFVDCFAGFRLQALQSIYEQFNVIAYHDANEDNDHYYDYSKLTLNAKYKSYIDKTFEAHTGLLVSNYFVSYIPEFIRNLEIEAEKFAADYNTTCELNFINNKMDRQ